MAEVGGKKGIIICIVILFFLTENATTTGQSNRNNHHFVLVHGSCHGAWSWYKVVSLLRSFAQNVTAIDLAASGINPKQVSEVPSISDYHRPLMKFMASLPPLEKVILVGHSFGGLAISQAMEIFPHQVTLSVFVTAMMPGPGLNISTLMQEMLRRQDFQQDNLYTYDNGPNNPVTAFTFGPKFLASKVYQLSPPEDLALATSLIRPLGIYSFEDMSRLLKLSIKKYGSVRRVFVMPDEDNVTPKDIQEWMIKGNPPDERRAMN
ncbi:esterase [Lithospermum erythrorhizon]|uniref:Esterase n=1 Tax=Lithospermum erythrorhizon TaxID=34254 RepID=A0AAV3QG96_LITER